MPARRSVPPLRRGAPNPLFSNTDEPPAPAAPVYQKTSVYLRPDQIELLDTKRAAHRKAGRRTVSASDLMRAAIDLALSYEEEWDGVVAEEAR